MVKKWGQRIYLAVIFLFLYLPILVLIVLSFNNSKSRVVWGGFTLKWYASCFTDETIMNAFVTTLQVTLTAAIVSTVIETLAAIGISAMKKKEPHHHARCHQYSAVKRGYRDRYFHDAAVRKIYEPRFRHRFNCTYYV